MYKRFKKYGSIESVKILKKPTEAYVTFKYSHDTGLAYSFEQENGAKIAHTWHQPKLVPPIMKLNKDCLFAIFDHCDIQTLVNLSETCKYLADLLQNQYEFPNIHETFRIQYHGGKFSMSLDNARKVLRFGGSRFRKLVFWKRDCGENVQDKIYDQMAPKYLQQIAKYCASPNIMCIYELRNDFISWLKPIFTKLEKLEIRRAKEFDANYDLADVLPQLQKLVINSDSYGNLAKSWPTLQSIAFLSVFSIDDNGIGDFLDLNPQLKCIKFKYGELENLGRIVPNIEKVSLALYQYYEENLDHLRALEHLTKLTLKLYIYSNENNETSNVMNKLAEFINLQQLKLHFPTRHYAGHDESLIRLVQANQNLERLDLSWGTRDENTVVDIVKHAKKLKVLHLHQCGIYATKWLVGKLAKEREPVLQQSGKLQLFFDKNDRNNVNAVQNEDVSKHLDIKWNCKHDYLRFPY